MSRAAAVLVSTTLSALTLPSLAQPASGSTAATATAPAAASTTAPAPTPAADAVPTIEVVGRRQSGAYESGDAEGTKSSMPLRELPQSVRVITRQSIDDLAAYRLDDLLDYVGGVSRQNSFGGLWDNIAIRGLAGNENTGMSMLLNGMPSNRGFNAPRDTANIERIEFLKGPVAALYGSSEPGGTVNLVTKKPRWQPGHAAEVGIGSYSTYRLALDSTGPLSESLAYRLNIAREDRGSFRNHVDSQRLFVAPALALRLSPATRLDYNSEWLEHRTPLDRGVVAVDNRLGAVPRQQFLGEPTDGAVTVNNQNHQLLLQHQLAPTWELRSGLAYKRGTLNGFSTEATALQADQRTLRRQRRFRDYSSDDWTAMAEVRGQFDAGAIRHDVLAGIEAYEMKFDQRMLRINPSAASPYAIDIYDPVYGQPQPTPLPNTDTRERQTNLAIYLQDAMHLSTDWRLMLSLRSDRYRQTFDNLRANTTTRQSDEAWTPRIGVSYLGVRGWSLFANAGTSFRANPGADAAGRAFEPEKGASIEVGVKWESADRRIGAGAALFDIRKRNALTADPANAGFSVATGQIRSRGIEADLAGQLTRQWRVNASLALIDASVLADNTLEVGGRLLNVPRVNASVLAVFEDQLPNGDRIGAGGGFTHVGRRLGEARTQAQADSGATAFDLPAYTTVKLLGFWRVNKNLRVSLDVDNLFDRTYYTQSFSRVWVAPGYPRTLTLGLQARF